MTTRKEYLLPTTLMALTALTGLALTAPSASADTSGTVTLTVDVPASCSLTVNPSSHTVTINPGNTGLIGTSTIKSICNDPAGLAVYAVGYTNDTYGNNNLSSTVGASTINIATSVTPSGTPATSEWNMTLAAISGDYTPTITTGFDSAHIIPDVYTKVAYRNTMTDIGTNATGAQFTASFNAYIAPTQAAGTYTGKVKFLLVHPNVLTYDSQTGDPDTVQPNTIDCDPNSPLLQNVATWGSSVALGETVDAIDSRDNQCYKVKRLKMNSAGTETALWMIENLRLDFSNTTLTSKTDAELESATHSPASGFFTAAKGATASNSGFDSSNYDTVKYSKINIGDTTIDSTGHTYDEYGIYYNWYTATAGHGTQNGITSGDVTGDICPYGWHLPTGGTGNNTDFKRLNAGINEGSTSSSSGLVSNANFLYSGSYGGSSASSRDSFGSYWSSTVNNNNNAYYFLFYSSSVGPGTSFYYKYNGRALRCLTDS